LKRQGDIYLYESEDGGEITVRNGEPVMDAGMETAAYLSLFSNEDEDHWINEYAKEDEKIESQFYAFIRGNPKTVTNMNKAKDLLRKDFDWMLRVGLADRIETDIESVSIIHVLLKVKILKDEQTINESVFKLNWRAQQLDPASGRI
jgi:phage gp46-like protein